MGHPPLRQTPPYASRSPPDHTAGQVAAVSACTGFSCSMGHHPSALLACTSPARPPGPPTSRQQPSSRQQMPRRCMPTGRAHHWPPPLPRWAPLFSGLEWVPGRRASFMVRSRMPRSATLHSRPEMGGRRTRRGRKRRGSGRGPNEALPVLPSLCTTPSTLAPRRSHRLRPGTRATASPAPHPVVREVGVSATASVRVW